MTNTHVSRWELIKKDFRKNRTIYLLAIPVILYYIIFCYIPMYGVTIAFKDFRVSQGFFAGDWVGFKHFQTFFGSYYTARIITNTLMINFLGLLFGFPAPIILALLINEVKNKTYKKVVQTISYLPHFISVMVISGMLLDFFSPSGVVNSILESLFGMDPINFWAEKEWFKPLYVMSDIWQGVGWGTIIYLAAMSNISTELYEAVTIDGGGRWKQTIHVTLPSLLPTIVVLLIMRFGNMMNLGYEKIILLYNPTTYETADVISSFVYRKGLREAQYSYSTAVGLFNSVVNLVMLVTANWVSRKVNDTSLW